jgi:hypothetical protein
VTIYSQSGRPLSESFGREKYVHTKIPRSGFSPISGIVAGCSSAGTRELLLSGFPLMD